MGLTDSRLIIYEFGFRDVATLLRMLHLFPTFISQGGRFKSDSPICVCQGKGLKKFC